MIYKFPTNLRGLESWQSHGPWGSVCPVHTAVLLLYQVSRLEAPFYPPLEEPPKQTTINPKTFPIQQTT